MKHALLTLLSIFILSFNCFAQQNNTIKIATGHENGVYYTVAGKEISRQCKFQIELIPTKGSIENLELLRDGKVDAAIIQYDAMIGSGITGLEIKLIGTLYPEYVHMIVKQNSEISNVTQLNPNKHKIAIGRIGSGTRVTWNTFCSLDEFYKKIPTVSEDGVEALVSLEAGDIDAVLMVTGLRHGNIMRANNKPAVFKLLPVNDWDFNNAKVKNDRVYNFTEITHTSYPNLFPGIFNSSVETIMVNSVLVTKIDWVRENPTKFESLYDAVASAVPNIKQILNK